MTNLDAPPPLSRAEISAAVEPLGWRLLLGELCASVAVGSLAEGAAALSTAVRAAGSDGEGHLSIDLRADRLELRLQTPGASGLTAVDLDLATRVSVALTGTGLRTGGVTSVEVSRPVQMLELCIDALDPAAIRPFWQAVLAFGDGPQGVDPVAALIDPAGQLPTVWFQQLDAPRPERNRIHLDISVSDAEAWPRVEAALAAGGVLVNDAEARAFWTVADVEGNEVCVCCWLDRDQPVAADPAALGEG